MAKSITFDPIAIIEVKTTTIAEDLVHCPDGTYRSPTSAVLWAHLNMCHGTPPTPPAGYDYVIGILRGRDGDPALGWRLQNQ